MEKYMIVAKCDPYNAKKHYNGQKVLRYDGSTPVEWVAADGMTMREAKNCSQIIRSIALKDKRIVFTLKLISHEDIHI